LQLQIETAAEALTQCESPGAIESAAEWRVNHDMRAAVFVKKSFDNDLLLRGHRSQRNFRHCEVFDDLFGCAPADTDCVLKPLERGPARRITWFIRFIEALSNLGSQSRYRF